MGKVKPASERHTKEIRLKLTPEQKEAFEAAARRAGLDLSSWLRSIATRESQRT